MLSNESQALKEATTVMKKFYSDNIEKELYFTAEKLEMEKYYLKLEGIKKGREEGIKEGMEEGMKKGIKEGIKEEKKEIARKMKKANSDIDFIKSITGLSEEEIMSLN